MSQAMPRKKPAEAITWLIENNCLSGHILHFGRGKDTPGTLSLSKIGMVTEYDPQIPEISDNKALSKQYDNVVSCFVLNCLRPKERGLAINTIAQAANGAAFIAVRSFRDPNLKVKKNKWSILDDGFVNKNQLFQKFYKPEDLIVELKKHFKTAFIIYDKGHYIIALGTNIKLPARSPKFGIGKQMIGCVYIHKSSEQILPGINRAKKQILENHNYDVVKFHWINNTFSFIQSPDFDLAGEPTVGDSLILHPNGKTKLIKAPQDPWIYHHKWLMVDDAYKGFSASQSKAHSVRWMKLNPDRSKIGKKSYWTKNILPLI